MTSFHIFFTIVLFIIIVAIFAWAYSKKRTSDFEAAARLPFSDQPVPKDGDC